MKLDELDESSEPDVVLVEHVTLSEIDVLSVVVELSVMDCSNKDVELEKLSEEVEYVLLEFISGTDIVISESDTSLAAHPVNSANAAITAICFIMLFILKSFPCVIT